LFELSFGHDADTAKPFEKIHAHRTFTAHAHAGWEEPLFFGGTGCLERKISLE
jgi:hypothetical protein